MTDPRPAVHRTLVVVDVEGFGDPRRTSRNQVAVRDGLWRAAKRAFRQAGIRWAGCHREDRGDGVLILAPAHVPKGRFVDALPRALVTALEVHNRGCSAEERMRLRMAVHAGEVIYDRHGVAGASVNLVFRLVEAEPLKAALASSPGMLAVIASRWFFEEVIRHLPSSGPASYRPVRLLVKETSTTAWICLPDSPYPADAGAALPPPPLVMAPRQLPAMVAGFVGRAAELTALDSLLEESADAGTVMISVVGGTAGVGKTSLAVRWAHTVAGQFPDGQLYVDLRGFDPSGSPMTSAEAVRGFLDAFEVPPERVPVSLDAQAALYRTLLAGRRVLVVADNARDAEQVRPLLPGSVGCVVVVTSRNRLTSLISAEGARPLTLNLLTCEEAGQLLSRRVGASRVAAEPQAAEKIIALCTRLPLALSIVAARAAAHPGFSLETLAAELRDAPCAPLGALDGGDRVTDMRAVFHWSYRQLSSSAARLFRLLGLHGGPDVTALAAASLAGLPQQAVRPLLTELTLAHMVTEHVAGRFALHDLLRAYAAEHANISNADDERQAAVRRMLDHYLHSAYNAAIWLHPRASPITLAPPVPGVVPQQLADDTAALAWFEAEYPVLLRTIKLSADTGQTVHAWQLPWTLTEFFARRPLCQAVVRHPPLSNH